MKELNQQFSEFLHTKGIKAKFKLAFSNMAESTKKQHAEDVKNFNEIKAKSIEENRDCVAFSLKEPTSSDIEDVLSLRYGKTEGMKLAESVKDYIKTYINDVHAKLYSDDFADVDSDNYYGDYLDVDSFVDWWIMEEFARNTDSNFFASCFMYYDPKDYLIHMGPVWDFDLGFGK